ncbi:MAG: radical SAM protein [Elusimicrobia bacterium]|nr:radical SAM protein [Elusimicrobiota bacterium]
MNILLISVSSEGALTSTVPDKYKDLSLGHYPPLGLMYLAAYLRAKSRHRAAILDTEIEGLATEAIIKRIGRERPDVLGFYTTSFNIHIVYQLVQALRTAGVGLPVVLGGPHIELFPAETVALPGVDYAIIGEGEESLKELLYCLESRGDMSAVQSVCHKKDGVAVCNPRRPLLENLDSLPFPARDLTHVDRYHSIVGRDKVSTTLMTSRGCPFRCNFCFVQYGGRYRSRSAESVLAELEECVKLGIREIFFFDEIFTAEKKRVMAICAALEKRRLGIVFDVRSRVDTVDREMLDALRRAGCMRIQYGIENGNDEILKAMNKRITVEQARRTVKMSKEAGLEVLIDFMLGYPGETREQMEKTMAFARELDPEYVQFGITTLFPGIKIYEDGLKSGEEGYWRGVAKAPPAKILPPFASGLYGREELEALQRKAYLGFYFRPSYLVKRLFKIGSFTALLRQAKAGYHLLFGN